MAATVGAKNDDAAWQLRRLNILIVDDEPLMSRALVRAIGRNHNTLTCVRAHEALALLAASPQPFDAILVDVRMPAMSGIELFHSLKKDRTLVTRLGFMTSGGASFDIESAIGLSGRPLLEKPFTGAQARAFVLALASAIAAGAP